MTVATTPGPGASQPWTRVLLPHEQGSIGSGLVGGGGMPWVWNAATAASLPSVARATSVYTTLTKQMALDLYRGIVPLPRPRLLDRPDPDNARSWFVQVEIEDYLWHGNALAYVTVVGADGWPLAVTWVPAAWCSVVWAPGLPVQYLVGGVALDPSRVVHVKRGADRWNPHRGMGVVEAHLATLQTVSMQAEYERNALSGSGVPSVAVIAPNPRLSSEEAMEAFDAWMDKFYGPVRAPAILPAGSQVIPLGWSPEDSQMIAARQMSLQDVANIFNLDGYYLGAPASSLTYRSPGQKYTELLRMSLEGVLSDFEDVWSFSFVPRGQSVRFDRRTLTRDDWQTEVDTGAKGTEAGLFSISEWRVSAGLPAQVDDGVPILSPVGTPEVVDERVDEEIPA